MKKPRARYYVRTYDHDTGKFTPQNGVPVGPYTLFGLRQALRLLRKMNYDACNGDPSVLIEEDTEKAIRGKSRAIVLPLQPLTKRSHTAYQELNCR